MKIIIWEFKQMDTENYTYLLIHQWKSREDLIKNNKNHRRMWTSDCFQILCLNAICKLFHRILDFKCSHILKWCWYYFSSKVIVMWKFKTHVLWTEHLHNPQKSWVAALTSKVIVFREYLRLDKVIKVGLSWWY